MKRSELITKLNEIPGEDPEVVITDSDDSAYCNPVRYVEQQDVLVFLGAAGHVGVSEIVHGAIYLY